MNKSEMPLKNCLDDLYQLGVIQGEHNINWADEYNLLEHSKDYYNKTKSIAEKYNITYDTSIEDYREHDDDEEYILLDRLTFNLNEIIKEHILNLIKEDNV